MAIALFVGKFDKPAVSTGGGFRKAIFRGETRTMTTCNDPVCCYPPIGRETENRIKMIRSMEQAYKKRPPRATANSPPVLADMGKLLYKSVKFKAQMREGVYAILCTQKRNSNKNTNIKNIFSVFFKRKHLCKPEKHRSFALSTRN